MTYSGYRIKVPGKLLIAGEYAVLEPEQQAVVIAVNRFITVTIEPSTQYILSLPDLDFDFLTWENSGNTIQLSDSDSQLQFIQHSIEVATQFLQESSIDVRPFHLTINSDLNDSLSGRKYGLGSSAAVVVAVISAILKLHCTENPSLDQIFKLSAISHLKTQKNGSGIDIAASTYGGWLMYSSFQPKWVLNELQKRTRLINLVEKPWPNLSITPLHAPTCLKLYVGWTKEVASTVSMINKVKSFQNKQPKEYYQFLKKSSFAVERLRKSFEENDCMGALLSLSINRQALKELGEHAGIKIETLGLEKLLSVASTYGSCKSSGAGGGDCGIVFMKGEGHREALYKEWRKVGIIPLNLRISEQGVKVKRRE
ncbi:phosphomevalonate kinase [Bacillus sp. REN16]|uniref:phosphomevalonate kinase n=1 Tax=Bacillus sp. REN16 TaxID=2887296 RepID=UPI001E45F37A|nr:phosphomevalonate kinase [Bacillus sp. REN16]MCC3357147.1 phosphomevalonate kinase [Bacillus sp. REN16]